MKAWIKPANSVTKKQKEAVKEYIKEEMKVQQVGSTRRVFKLFCVALHEEYGFGKGRLSRCWEQLARFVMKRKMTPCFGLIWIE